MKIRLAIVTPDLLPHIRGEVEILRNSVDAGDMDAVDAATARLLSLTAECPAIEMSQEEWRHFAASIKSKKPHFEARYLLPSEVFTAILPTITANDTVLELPIDGEADNGILAL
ncbi:hypothetical protein [Thermopirellula anaerolimosa]